jgi:hypothetical protein
VKLHEPGIARQKAALAAAGAVSCAQGINRKARDAAGRDAAAEKRQQGSTHFRKLISNKG